MVGYDPEDPITARGVGHIPDTFTKFLNKDGLKGVRLGILRESIGLHAEAESEDFKKVSEVFDKAVGELKAAGAEIIDPIVIPKIKELLAKRSGGPGDTDQSFKNYYGRSAKRRSRRPQEVIASTDFAKVVKHSQERFKRNPDAAKHYESLRAQDELMTNFLKVMADHKLDAIVHKAVEHQPTLIKDGVNPPFVDQKGAPHSEHLSGLRSDHCRARGIHARQPAGGRLLHRTTLRRWQPDQVRLRLRTSDASSPPAGEHDGALKAK